MQVQTVQTLEGLQRQVDIVLPVAEVEAEVKKQLLQVARQAKIQGFRPGKAPLSVVERSHGPSVRYDVINQKVGDAFDKIAQENELRVAGMPSIEPKTDDVEEGRLAFTAKFEVFPTIELPDFTTLEVTKFNTDVGEEQVNSTLDILRKQRADYIDVDRAAQQEDRVTLDFVGKIDGEEFAGGKADDFPFVLGQGSMLPEFEEAAEGMKAGEEKTFDLSFPEDYQGEEVAGKTAQFTITMKKVQEAKLPEVDSEFAKDLGQEDGDVEHLKEEILKNISREAENRILNRTKTNVMDALVKAAEFDVPSALVENETQQRIADTREEFKSRGMPNADEVDLPAELFKEEAERRVRLGLLVADLVEKEGLKATDEQVRSRIENFAQNYEQPEEVVSYYLTDSNRRAEMEALVLEDNVVDFVLSKAKVTESELPFTELMGQA